MSRSSWIVFLSLPFVCGLVQCTGDDPALFQEKSENSGADAAQNDAAVDDAKGDDASSGDATDDSPDGDSVFAMAPMHWAASSPFGPTGAFVGIDALGNTFAAFTFNRPTAIGTTAIGNSGGLSDVGVVKFDAHGNVLWQKVFGGSAEESLQDMHVDAAGNVYLVGSFASSSLDFGAKTLTKVSSSGTDMFVAKLDATGAAVAAFDYTTAGPNGGACTKVDVSAGKVLVGCYLFGNANVAMQDGSTKTVTAVSAASNALVVLLRDTDLKAIWTNEIGGSSGDSVSGVALAPSGAIGYAAVSYNSGSLADANGSMSGLGGGGSGVLIARLDMSNGNVVWHVVHDYNANTDFMFVRTMAATSVAVVVGGELGGTMTVGGKTLTSHGARDAVVAAYFVNDGSGRFGRSYGGPNDEGVFGLAVDTTDHVFASMTYLVTGFAIDGVTVPDAVASSRNEVAFEVLGTASPTVQPWNRVLKSQLADASATNIQTAGIAVSPTRIVVGGNYRGYLDLGNGNSNASFDPFNNGWDDFVVAYTR